MPKQAKATALALIPKRPHAQDITDYRSISLFSKDVFLSRLIAKGFPTAFVSWIKGCISDVHFSISINRALEGYFNSSSGLRQGCPLSPYLFCIIMDSLSSCFEEANLNNSFRGIEAGNATFSHLLYADNLLVFAMANEGNAHSLNVILDNFATFSGLQVRGTLIPKTCIKKINSLCSRFLYYGDIHKMKLHMISWKDTYKPKTAGGLGIPTIESLYHAFGCRTIWRYCLNGGMLSIILSRISGPLRAPVIGIFFVMLPNP
ncbi:uncharacterized protein LOC110115388 [Dendrobium catenatum]|uniref:uncharacterized protein LOC110115388 n=1 Tax=Dendrobium catenatum TaxID=906689 RepID=UPI0009F28D46|nr:uncharacterized protein LOC110115388 [Dendrobium catenatum]